MSIQEIKKQLHAYIDMIEDETELQMLNEAAEVYATSQPEILDLLSSEQQKRLDESIKQADEGKLVSHEEIMKQSKQWLMK